MQNLEFESHLKHSIHKKYIKDHIKSNSVYFIHIFLIIISHERCMINSKNPNTARLFLRTNKQRKFIKRLLGTSTTMFNELSESTEKVDEQRGKRNGDGSRVRNLLQD